MSTLEKTIECNDCPWTGRRILERVAPEEPAKDGMTLTAFGITSPRCPECGGFTTSSTKEMVS